MDDRQRVLAIMVDAVESILETAVTFNDEYAAIAIKELREKMFVYNAVPMLPGSIIRAIDDLCDAAKDGIIVDIQKAKADLITRIALRMPR